MSTSKIWNLRGLFKKPLGINNLTCGHEFLSYCFIKAFYFWTKIKYSTFNAMRQFSSLRYLCMFSLYEVEQLANSYL